MRRGNDATGNELVVDHCVGIERPHADSQLRLGGIRTEPNKIVLGRDDANRVTRRGVTTNVGNCTAEDPRV